MNEYLRYSTPWIFALIVCLGVIVTLVGGMHAANVRANDAEQIVWQKGVMCKDLLADPVVQRIMSAK